MEFRHYVLIIFLAISGLLKIYMIILEKEIKNLKHTQLKLIIKLVNNGEWLFTSFENKCIFKSSADGYITEVDKESNIFVVNYFKQVTPIFK